MADEIEARAVDTRPLLGEFIMRGQSTMLYAAPNTGKTLVAFKLCLNAIEQGRIDPSNLYYVNADDSSKGLSDKLRLLQDVGAHMLVPGLNGFKAEDLVNILIKAGETDSAHGTCVIIDTLKKFADLMDKKRSSGFAQVCREYVMAGGTIVALGHTAKNPNADGTPRYQGTTDVVEDFDAAYVAQPLTSRADASQKVVKLTRIKCRADSPATVAYAYDGSDGLSYGVKVASLRNILPSELDCYAPPAEQFSDAELKDAFQRIIEVGNTEGKMALGKAVAKECSVSHRTAIEVLERYTGTEPKQHLWNYETGPRGVRMYRLLEQPSNAI